MLNEQKIGEERYVCNQCGHDYDVRDALIAKGSVFFCCKECVLKYDEEKEALRQ